MGLVVEDGTGRADADSYVSLAEATAYHAGLGNAAWAALASDDEREQKLRQATVYMAAYRLRWAGVRVTASQALDWPRYDVPMRDAPGYGEVSAYYPTDAVPVEVRRACAELAQRAIDGPLSADLDAPLIRETVGPITTEYAAGARQTKRYAAVDDLLAPFLKGGGSSIPVARA